MFKYDQYSKIDLWSANYTSLDDFPYGFYAHDRNNSTWSFLPYHTSDATLRWEAVLKIATGYHYTAFAFYSDSTVYTCNGLSSWKEVTGSSGGGIQSYVGMIIYSSTLDTNEKVVAVYGGTTWTKIENVFLLGQGSSYSIRATGGEATHTLTVNEMPSHNHTFNMTVNDGGMQGSEN